MNDFYNKLSELTEKGQITKTVSSTKGDIFVKQPDQKTSRIVHNGTWEIEKYFHGDEWIADRNIITLESGEVYEDRLSLFSGFYNL
ncbi:hypothetical protein [Flavobacterium sp. 3HN19-14]|uniref:hypothetical protein n=1 Tax=Flavobacterium sp. 3HN19-14 TaxID=3448133 RepID=UPI003EE352F5